jgi:hypothetical protein
MSLAQHGELLSEMFEIASCFVMRDYPNGWAIFILNVLDKVGLALFPVLCRCCTNGDALEMTLAVE